MFRRTGSADGKRSTSMQRSPAPPKKGTGRKQWHLFQPNPELEQSRRRILQQRRKRSSWKKQKIETEKKNKEQHLKKMKRKIRQQEEQRIKYQGGVSKNTKMEETDNNQEENEEQPKLGLIAQEELNQKEFEDTANAFGSFDPFGGDDGGGGGGGGGGDAFGGGGDAFGGFEGEW